MEKYDFRNFKIFVIIGQKVGDLFSSNEAPGL